jgi:hypothetical protein
LGRYTFHSLWCFACVFSWVEFFSNPHLCDLSPLIQILHHCCFHSRYVNSFNPPNCHLHLDLVWFLGLALLVLDPSSYAKSTIHCALPLSSSALWLPVFLFRSSSSLHRASVASLTTLPMLVIFGFGVMFLVFKLLICLVWLLLGLYLLFLMFYVFVFGFVLVTLCASVPSTDFNSALAASIIVRWSLLVYSRGSDFFCAPFAYVTTLCGPLRESGHLFNPFPTLCNYCCTIVVCFEFVVGEPTPFSMLGSPISSSFWIISGKDPP